MAKPSRDDSFLRFVLERLDALPALHARAMFGGHGLSAAGRFFDLVRAALPRWKRGVMAA